MLLHEDQRSVEKGRASPGPATDLVHFRAAIKQMREGFALCEIVPAMGDKPARIRLVECNAALARCFGKTRASLLNRTLAQAVPNARSFWLDVGMRVTTSGLPLHVVEVEPALANRSFDILAYPSGPRRFAMLIKDITEQLTATQHQALLVREMAHRVKNTLAVVQSVATQTARRYPAPEAFVAVFQARLVALARAHDILMQREWSGAPIDVVVREAVGPHVNSRNGEVRIDTSSCMAGLLLTPAQSLALGMMLHELATNAHKHGSLASPRGSVSVTCKHGPVGIVVVDWVEAGGARIVEAPKQEGFGFRLLRHGAGAEGLTAKMEFAPEGLRCSIRIDQLKQRFAVQ